MQQPDWRMPAAVPSIDEKAAGRSPATPSDRLLGAVVRRQLVSALAAWRVGRLSVHLPGGELLTGGTQGAEPHATLWFDSEAFFRKFALGGDLGAGESYMDGDWRTDDLARLVELVLRNQHALPLESPLSRFVNVINDWRHRRRANTRRGSRRLDRVRALGFDARFVRMWEYYLATCEAAFRTRNLGLAHLVLARAGEDLR